MTTTPVQRKALLRARSQGYFLPATPMRTYKIVRFYFRGNRRTMATGLSLESAQAHCSDTRTSKPGKWFDGYEREGS
mgnify:CR=1 FL=1